ncbi:hypothetical protein K2173_000303 [Erythroxylum novogranatense]|uniref:Uncharacterized protein n=1 Tax=Erythroxylum novogranatense TaxID=1862640 RepID=A0AAV8SW34_9ROSI|nr:hypothetical protein K2173_000303 [Erythroxylum novogranatense]
MAKHHEFSFFRLLIIFFLTVLLLLPEMVSSDCTCESEENDEDTDTSDALKYKLIAIGTILCAGALGVGLPFLVHRLPWLHPDKEAFSLIKAFAAGVILATGFVHILPEAFDSLTSPCLNEHPWKKFPITGLVTMLTAIGTLMIESLATGYHKRMELSLNKEDRSSVGGHANDEEHGHHSGGGHAHGSAFAMEGADSSDLVRHRIVSQVLELGIIVHSVVIGIALGAARSAEVIRPLVAALSFHQFFEGMGLGGSIFKANFKVGSIVIMVIFFSLTTPTGIAVGIGISHGYNTNSPTALIVQGLLNAASAGILIYMALVDLLAHEFMESKVLTNLRLQIWANVALFMGTCCMSLLAVWA